MGASAGAAVTASDLLSRAAASTVPALHPRGSNGVEHVVVLMMENRSFDHFLGWLPGADGVTPAEANTFPIGYYTNLDGHREHKAVPDLPVIGALAENYTVLDRYFCSFAGETFPNRFYQHAARTDRDHNSNTISTLPAIWDHLSPIPNTQGVPTGGYFFRDLPFLALWGTKYFPFWHPFAPGDVDALGIPVTTPPFLDMVAQGQLPNVSFVDPAFDTESNGTSADDHPLADIRLGERFIADTYHALADAGYLDNTVLVVTFDEWGGFYDHVPPPRVVDDTDPGSVDHTGDDSTPTEGRLVPDYRQLGFRVPTIVVSNLAPASVLHHAPFEHTSTLKLIESTFGLPSLTARDAHAENLGQVLRRTPRPPVPSGAIPRSSQVLGPMDDAAAVCSADSVQSVSPPPVRRGQHPARSAAPSRSGWPTGAGMAGLAQHLKA
jgi:phospholipase C